MGMADRLAACTSTLREQGAIRTATAAHAFRRDRCATHSHPSPGSRIDVAPKAPPEAASDVIHRDTPLPGGGAPGRAPLPLAGPHSTQVVRINRDDTFGTPARSTSSRDYDRSPAAEEFTRPEYPIPIPTRR
ncbi:hypothetical protein ACIQMJ_27270 [Actinosynnema sp. NPDC091369]